MIMKKLQMAIYGTIMELKFQGVLVIVLDLLAFMVLVRELVQFLNL
jgi:hypothetical protein